MWKSQKWQKDADPPPSDLSRIHITTKEIVNNTSKVIFQKKALIRLIWRKGSLPYDVWKSQQWEEDADPALSDLSGIHIATKEIVNNTSEVIFH